MQQPRRQLLDPSRSSGAWRLAGGALLILVTIPIESCAGRMPYHDDQASMASPAPAAEAAAAAMAPAAEDAAPASPNAPPAETAVVSFDATVRPILAGKCAPCHNPGGKMYERLPFDDAKTVASHAEGISRRLKGDDLAALQKWLESLPPPAAH
jgi:hypothetical protein